MVSDTEMIEHMLILMVLAKKKTAPCCAYLGAMFGFVWLLWFLLGTCRHMFVLVSAIFPQLCGRGTPVCSVLHHRC